MVNGVTNAANTSSTSTTSNSNSVLGKDDFLKMLMTQLKNQDPLNPTDATQFASQLAQFSSLEQLSNLNTSVNNSINANYLLTQSINNTLSSTLIGKEVKLSGDTLQYKGQGNIDFGYNLPSNASKATVQIYDSNGSLVKTIEDAPTSAGDNKLSWDFTDNNGNKLPQGDYTFKVSAVDGAGADVTSSPFQVGTIDAVRFTDQGTKLVVGGAEYQLSDIMEIVNPTTENN